MSIQIFSSKCKFCKGTGDWDTFLGIEDCPECGGTGNITPERRKELDKIELKHQLEIRANNLAYSLKNINIKYALRIIKYAEKEIKKVIQYET